MKKTDLEPNLKHRDKKSDPDDDSMYDYPGYEQYPSDEDIFRKNHIASEIDPEALSNDRTYPRKGVAPGSNIAASYTDIDLDIPGVEFDDELESIGSEDEENNYYSIVDDNFDELEDILER